MVRPLGPFTYTRFIQARSLAAGGAPWTAFLSGVGAPLHRLRGGFLAALHFLICRVGTRACGLPMAHVREVMRRSAVERVQPAPAFMLGVALIRGENVPVVDAGVLLTGKAGEGARFVVLRVAERSVALAVDEVFGVRGIEASQLGALPPLLADAADRVQAMAVLDGRLLEILESGRLIAATLAVPASNERGVLA